MKKEEIHIDDLQRILFGNAPPIFLLEVFIRTLIIYLATLAIMRLLGKRMNGQLTIVEMAVMITMGAIIALPMQAPNRGLLPGLLILVGALYFLRGLNLWSFKNRSVERIAEGDAALLVKEGVLDIGEMTKASVSRQQVFAALRNKNIYSLGAVKRVYLEACGLFSIYRQQEPRPGLSAYPSEDEKIAAGVIEYDMEICNVCGHEAVEERICPNCKSNEWVHPVTQ